MDAVEYVNKIAYDFEDSLQYLNSSLKITEKNNLEILKVKVSILTLGTYIENRTYDLIVQILNRSKDDILSEFLINQALNRKFHTMFDFKSLNIKKFLKLFGQPFSDYICSMISDDEEFSRSIECFMLISSKRNILAHDNFYISSIDFTFDEIINKAKYINIFFLKFLEYAEKYINNSSFASTSIKKGIIGTVPLETENSLL